MTSEWLDSQYIGTMQKLSVLTGQPNTWLFAYSGNANINQVDWTGWDSEKTSAYTVKIKLDNITGVLLEWAGASSLAQIFGGGGPSIGAAGLALEDNGDLVYSTDLYVYAEGPFGQEELDIYSYYVTAKILLDAASISGTVRWRKTLAQPGPAPLFAVTANSEVPASPGSFGTSQVEATGAEGPLDSSDPAYYYAPYTITGALIGKTVFVSVTPIPAKFIGAPAGGSLVAQQISGPTQITITNSNLHVTNVDFEIISESVR